MSAEENKALVRRWFEGSTREERFEVSEQERGREAAERARAHLASCLLYTSPSPRDRS